MPQHLDHHDAELLLRLYELRREEKLRLARAWFLQEVHDADSLESLMKRIPFGTQENAYYRMVVSYWDMAASLLNHGLINEGLFFENNAELWAIWMKIEARLPALREMLEDQHAYKNLEIAGKKYEAWMENRSPGALAVRRTRLRAIAAGGPQEK